MGVLLVHNVEAQGRCAPLSRSAPWSAELGTMLDDRRLFNLINKLLLVDILHRLVPQWICPVV